MKCACGSGKELNQCCQPIIDGKSSAVVAEELMRSRYTAFTQANGRYLIYSHHSSTRKTVNKRDLESWAKSVQWMGLTILSKSGNADDETAFVEFRALFMEQGALEQVHEKSLFRKENGEWKYVSGKHF
ncbi:Sec-C motif domain protein [Prolixibacteraceae bacterium JC049]|nr:Sec-C motif domain protein [Prolixibacteraceae bacterium JC049]